MKVQWGSENECTNAPVGGQNHVKRHVPKLMHPSCSKMLQLPRGYNELTSSSRDSKNGPAKPLWQCEGGPGPLDTCALEDRKKMKLSNCDFPHIRKAIALAAEDKLFLLGDTVLERTRSWPMGGSFSEPAKLVDLGESVFHL